MDLHTIASEEQLLRGERKSCVASEELALQQAHKNRDRIAQIDERLTYLEAEAVAILRRARDADNATGAPSGHFRDLRGAFRGRGTPALSDDPAEAAAILRWRQEHPAPSDEKAEAPAPSEDDPFAQFAAAPDEAELAQERSHGPPFSQFAAALTDIARRAKAQSAE